MDAFGEWLLQRQPPLDYDVEEGDIEVSDILLFEKALKVETKKICNADLVPWVDGSATSGNCDGMLGAMRIVWVEWYAESGQPRIFKMSHDNMEYVQDRFELKRALCLLPLPGFSFQRGNPSPPKKQSFAFAYEFGFVMAWKYDFMTSRTEVYFKGVSSWVRHMQEVIQSQQSLGLHPLFMGVVVVLVMVRNVTEGLKSAEWEITSVESRTQHSHVAIAPAARGAVGSYAFLSAKMSGQAQLLAWCERNCALIQQNLDWLSRFKWPQDIEKPNWLERVVEEVDECSHFVRNHLKSLELTTCLLSQRANIQLTALFNLISQQETRVAISVAQDSRTLASATKDDSTAMKTLAAVTVVFLPGTFVAALFSMPLFQWDTAKVGDSTISRQFWIYWAVTLPLTMLTLTFWGLWMRLQTRRRRARDEEGRAALDREIDEVSRETEESGRWWRRQKGSKQA